MVEDYRDITSVPQHPPACMPSEDEMASDSEIRRSCDAKQDEEAEDNVLRTDVRGKMPDIQTIPGTVPKYSNEELSGTEDSQTPYLFTVVRSLLSGVSSLRSPGTVRRMVQTVQCVDEHGESRPETTSGSPTKATLRNPSANCGVSGRPLDDDSPKKHRVGSLGYCQDEVPGSHERFRP